jgi:GNAT superfamily N-acetyltransferase
MESVVYKIRPVVTDAALNALFAVSWPDHRWRPFAPVLSHSLTFVCAYRAGELIGFVNLVWDGRVHAFLLDTTVHPAYRHQGIGQQLVRRAVDVARAQGLEWVHVDFEPHLATFYQQCGFRPTLAGLIQLLPDATE